jgi:hypothetical protein
VPALSTIVQKGNIVEWISVKERFPERPTQNVIVWVSRFNFPSPYMTLAQYKNGKWTVDESRVHEVTHWMPLPPPPKE